MPVASASVLLPSIQNQNQCVNELSTTADIRKDADALSDLPGVSRLVAEHEEGHASNYVAVQAPSYIHEVHLLAVSMVNDLIDLERRAREGVRLIVAQFEEEEERERLLGGVDRAQALDLIRLEKQLLPVRRRYRTQEDRDEMTAAKLALGEIESPAPPLEVFVDSSSRNDSDSDSESNSESEDSIDISGISVEVDRLHGSGSIFDIASRSVSNFSTGRHASSVWAVNLVDVYTCPRTQQISHAFQVTYCSMTRPIGRTVADTYRKRVERDLPIYLGMVPRVVKHGGLVSLSYPWYVTAAVKSHLAAAALSSANVYSGTGSEIGVVSVGDEGNLIAGGERVDVSDLAAILRELEREEKGRTEKAKAMEIGGDSDHDDSSNCSTSDDVNTTDSDFGAVSDRENIRTIARTLWKKRVGVLMQSTNPSNKV